MRAEYRKILIGSVNDSDSSQQLVTLRRLSEETDGFIASNRQLAHLYAREVEDGDACLVCRM